MKRILIGAAVAAFAIQAGAGDNYVGAKYGITSVRDSGLGWDTGSSLGLLYGYDIPDNDIAIEAEFTTTVSSVDSTGTYGDLDVTTLGVYAVFRNPGTFYFKGKAGLLYEYLNSSVGPIDVDEAAIVLSLGLGGGIRFNETLSAEIEYTFLEWDIAFASVGVNYSF